MNFAVGMEWRSIKAFEKAFEPSMRAARAEGPNTGIPTVMMFEHNVDKMKWKITYLYEKLSRRHLRGVVRAQEGPSRSRVDIVGFGEHGKVARWKYLLREGELDEIGKVIGGRDGDIDCFALL